MDPNNQGQLTDSEQIMLGAQQAALLQQIHDDEIETKAMQQQHMLNEEKMLEAQQEAMAIQQIRQAQEMAEQQKEAELHRLQTFAMIEQKQEMQFQQGVPHSQPQPGPQQQGTMIGMHGGPSMIGGSGASSTSGLSGGPGVPMGSAPVGPPPSGMAPAALPTQSVMPPGGLPPSGMPQSSVPQTAGPPAGLAQSAIPQTGMSQSGLPAPPGLPQSGHPPSGMTPPGMPPSGLMPPGSQSNLPPPAMPPSSVPQAGLPPPGLAQANVPPGSQTLITQSQQPQPSTVFNHPMSSASAAGPPNAPPPQYSQQQGPPHMAPPPGQGPPGETPPLMGIPSHQRGPAAQGPPPSRPGLGPPSGGLPPGTIIGGGAPPQEPFPGPGLQRPPGSQPPGLGPSPVINQSQGPPKGIAPSNQSQDPDEDMEDRPVPSGPPLKQMPVPQPSGPGNIAPKGPSQVSAPREIKLPQALEKVLAFKGVRAQQMGVKPEDVERVEKGEIIDDEEPSEEDHPQVLEFEETESPDTYPEYHEEEEEEEPTEQKATQSKKESKNKRKKKKKKRAKARKAEEKMLSPIREKDIDDDVEIEYVPEELVVERSDPAYAEFSRIFEAFKIAEDKTAELPVEAQKEPVKAEVPIKARGLIPDDDDSSDENDGRANDDDKPRLSKKKQKKLNRLSVAELKQLVHRPDVVEMHDVTARDPKLLVHIKATRNTVTVPRHWCFKRKYLQGKRGIEKAPFDLPDFIKATGIMEMRQALQEKEDQKTMKSKMRERVRPKMGKIDIDYQKLHDAFFKWQTKPKLSTHGDLYYEGKEFETRLKEKKPGNLTDELRTALGMPIGPNANNYPPPWLIAMQRYGPPPSYPNLKIPGLNAPIPESCAFGYHAGGWGKPPVDESGKPLYGDVFGTQTADVEMPVQDEDIDKTRWGELESESEEESDEEEESEEEEDATGLVTPGDAGLITPSGVTSVPIGVETPDMIELRKKRIEDAMDQGGDTPALYQVIPEKKTTVGGAMMGSAHVYDISAVTGKKAPDKAGTEGVEVALNPDELDLDSAAMQAKYDQTMREQQSQLEKEDLSDMVAEHAAKQQRKRKKQQQEGKSSSKKYKEFKF